MILLAIELREERAAQRERDQREHVPEPHSYSDQPPLAPDQMAQIPFEVADDLVD